MGEKYEFLREKVIWVIWDLISWGVLTRMFSEQSAKEGWKHFNT